MVRLRPGFSRGFPDLRAPFSCQLPRFRKRRAQERSARGGTRAREKKSRRGQESQRLCPHALASSLRPTAKACTSVGAGRDNGRGQALPGHPRRGLGLGRRRGGGVRRRGGESTCPPLGAWPCGGGRGPALPGGRRLGSFSRGRVRAAVPDGRGPAPAFQGTRFRRAALRLARDVAVRVHGPAMCELARDAVAALANRKELRDDRRIPRIATTSTALKRNESTRAHLSSVVGAQRQRIGRKPHLKVLWIF